MLGLDVENFSMLSTFAALPDEEREVVDLLYYEGLSQEEAAAILACSVRTGRRRWNDAKFRLHGGLNDGSPLPDRANAMTKSTGPGRQPS